jgi:hypothetical protein
VKLKKEEFLSFVFKNGPENKNESNTAYAHYDNNFGRNIFNGMHGRLSFF